MKYGFLGHIGFSKKGQNHNRLLSMGDIFECLAILEIYKEMGVEEEELATCYPYDLETYEGEYLVLPINVYALNIDYSRRLLPVFLGLTMGGGVLQPRRKISICLVGFSQLAVGTNEL